MSSNLSYDVYLTILNWLKRNSMATASVWPSSHANWRNFFVNWVWATTTLGLLSKVMPLSNSENATDYYYILSSTFDKRGSGSAFQTWLPTFPSTDGLLPWIHFIFRLINPLKKRLWQYWVLKRKEKGGLFTLHTQRFNTVQ